MRNIIFRLKIIDPQSAINFRQILVKSETRGRLYLEHTSTSAINTRILLQDVSDLGEGTEDFKRNDDVHIESEKHNMFEDMFSGPNDGGFDLSKINT